MNTGAFGEGFPYSNFHNLNMDWIIKIAKDFLDQYTHIQEIIEQGETDIQNLTETGLEQLQEKADNLEELLQAWYDEHSEDIADELADALADLNDWYTTHSGYLDQILEDNVSSFRTSANAIAEEVIATIPADYSALSAQVTANTGDITNLLLALLKSSYSFRFNLIAFVGRHSESDSFIASYGTGAVTTASDWTAYDGYIPAKANTVYTITRNGQISGAFYDSNKTFISGFANATDSTSIITVTSPADTAYMRISGKTATISALAIFEGIYANPSLSESVHIPDFIAGVSTAINVSNYQTLLPDANAINYSSVYKMYFSAGSADIPAHLPFPRWCSSKSAMLFTMWKDAGNTGGGSNAGGQQLLIANNFIFHRDFTSTWGDWESIYCEVNIGTGYGTSAHFSSLTETVVFATKYKNVIVNVFNGDFNLINEFKAYYGNDFFDNFTENTRPKGLHLTNGIHLNFKGNAQILFQYTGDNQYVKQQFSPINYLSDCKYGFTLENAKIVCSNCRYGIHDDPGDSTTPYNNKYINCFVEIDNRNNTDWDGTKAIGGGCGRNGHITIDSCILRVVKDTPVTTDEVVSYHSDVNTNSGRSTVTFKNNVLFGGTFNAYYGGARIDFIITNNSMYGNLLITQTPSAEYPNANNVYAWNNVNRAS